MAPGVDPEFKPQYHKKKKNWSEEVKTKSEQEDIEMLSAPAFLSEMVRCSKLP
jgi:hypothetical protein